MTDIQFAKEHMGEYFQFKDYKVRVIGYDTTGTGKSVIIDFPLGWSTGWITDNDSPTDVIYKTLCKTGRCFYVSWEDLK